MYSEAVEALKGEGIDYEEAKAFCESKSACLPKKKLEFLTAKTNNYWLDIEDSSTVDDPELLKVIEEVRFMIGFLSL